MSKHFDSILLIDDNMDDNFFHKRVLEKCSIVDHIVIKQSAIDALEYLKTEKNLKPPELIFLDINMPGMNGWRFLEEFGSLGPNLREKAVIVMLTTSESSEEKNKAASFGYVCEFVTKPLTREIIELVVSRCSELDRKEVFQGVDIGEPGLPGYTIESGSGYDLVAGGGDIGESNDQFHFGQVAWKGDFDFRVRVEALEAAHEYTKAGIMVRESLEPASTHFLFLVFPDNRLRNNNSGGYEAQFRAQTNRDCLALYPNKGTALPPDFPVRFPDTWLRLVRKGTLLEASAGWDGRTWTPYVSFHLAFPFQIFLGLALTAHDNARTVRARFRNLEIDGGSFQREEKK